MKSRWFALGKYEVKQFEDPLRKTIDVARIAVECAQYISSGIGSSEEALDKPYLQVFVDKMRRIFICTDSRLYSIGLPFMFHLNRDGTCGFSFQGKDLDSLTLSVLVSVLRDERLDEDISRLSEVVDDVGITFGDSSVDLKWIDTLAAVVVSFDYGYVRFDRDEENEDGSIHPLYHLDICYSGEVQYKVGLHDDLDCSSLADILNIRSSCRYLV